MSILTEEAIALQRQRLLHMNESVDEEPVSTFFLPQKKFKEPELSQAVQPVNKAPKRKAIQPIRGQPVPQMPIDSELSASLARLGGIDMLQPLVYQSHMWSRSLTK